LLQLKTKTKKQQKNPTKTQNKTKKQTKNPTKSELFCKIDIADLLAIV